MNKLSWGIDLDGVITANPGALSWLTYHLAKNENNHQLYVLTWRDGSDKVRKEETLADLKKFGITYTRLIMAPKRFKNAREAADWKIKKVGELGIDIWLDDEIKIYKRDYLIDLNKLLPDVVKIHI